MNKFSESLGLESKVIAIALAVVIVGGCATAKQEKAVMAAPAPAEPATQIVIKEKVLDASQLFAFDSAVLTADGMAELDGLISQAGNAAGTISVTGHADRIGDEDYNMRLSEQRANAVADYMIGKGIAAGSISAMGKGESEPVVQCDDTNWKALVECLAPNRRVVVEYPIKIEEEVIIQN